MSGDNTYPWLQGLIQGPQGAQGTQGATGGDAGSINVAAVTATFNHVNNIQKFVLTVTGVSPGAAVWASLNGDTTPSGEKAGVLGAWCSGTDQVTLLAYYPGSEVVLDVPVLIFWI